MSNWQRWTKQERQFVRKNATRMTDGEMAEVLGRTTGSVQAFRGRNNIDKGGGLHYAPWTDVQDEVIQKHWPSSPKSILQQMLPGRTMSAIQTRAKNLGVDREAKFSHATRYKPQRVVKEIPEGLVTIRTSAGINYAFLITGGQQSTPYHRWRWEREVGKIPAGYCLVCRTDNTTNAAPDNWKLVPIKEHLKKYSDTKAGMQALQAYRQQHGFEAKNLTDAWIAGVMAAGDEELKEYIIRERPDVIRAARANYKLKRSINEQT